MKPKPQLSLRSLWVAFSDLAFAFFFLWYILSVFTHGYFVMVSLLNMFAFELFLLLIPFALTGFVLRIRRFQVASLLALVLFAATYWEAFIPKQKPVPSSPDVLKVMTYNMLVFTPDVSKIADVIREEDADIVFLQETSFAMADYFQKEMIEEYPYQIHDPSDIPLGMSVISKYPFETIDHRLEGHWVGTPILLAVGWNGRRIHVIDFHFLPTNLSTAVHLDVARMISASRVEDAQSILNFLAENRGVPAVVAGDANDVSLNDSYRLLTGAGLQDSWTEAGFGLGHTFPGNKSPGTSRTHIGDLYIPEWMIRIDYIFASQDWEVLSAHIAKTDGYSDHRSVVAFLRLK